MQAVTKDTEGRQLVRSAVNAHANAVLNGRQSLNDQDVLQALETFRNWDKCPKVLKEKGDKDLLIWLVDIARAITKY